MDLDPFEARLEFLNLLGKVNASQQSIHKVGSFAMRNKNLYEDLYSCIIEEMDQTSSINARMNLFYVLDSICQHSHKARFTGYIDLVRRNLASIISKVTPTGPKGDVNVAATRKVLESWRARKVFSESVIDQVQAPLLSRGLAAKAPTAETGLTQDDILKRMEEDRERHKRIREEIWIRPQDDEDTNGEFFQHWDEVSDMDDKDYEELAVENAKHLPDFPWTEEFDRWKTITPQGGGGVRVTAAAAAGSAMIFDSDMPAGGVQKRRKLPSSDTSDTRINPASAPAVHTNKPERPKGDKVAPQVPITKASAPIIPSPRPVASSAQPAIGKPNMTTTPISTVVTDTRPSATTAPHPSTLTSATPLPRPDTKVTIPPPLTLKTYVEANKSPTRRRMSTESSSSSISSVPTTDPNSSLSSSPAIHSAASSPRAPPPPPSSRARVPSAPSTSSSSSSSAIPHSSHQGPLPPPPPPSSSSSRSLSSAPKPLSVSTSVSNRAASSSSDVMVHHANSSNHAQQQRPGSTTPSTPTSATTNTPASTPQRAAPAPTTPTTSGGERLSLQQYLQQQRLLRANAGSDGAASSSSAAMMTPAATTTSTPSIPVLTPPSPPQPIPPSSPSESSSAAAAAAAAGYFPLPTTTGHRHSSHGRSQSTSYS